jgi:dihydroorotate dehydrogenase
VVGTLQQEWSLDDLADDYARSAAWAVESGADCVETNLSCPNVSTCDGQLYQNPNDAGIIVRRVRQAIGKTPYVVKIGHVRSRVDARRLLEAIGGWVDALAMTNSVSAKVLAEGGEPLFNGDSRGICGASTREASLAQVQMFSELLHETSSALRLIGGGGVAAAEHVRQYLDCGASAVHIATAAMTNPLIALEIKAAYN